MLKKLIFCCIFLSLLACAEDDQREAEIAQIPVEVEISRFDQRFARATADSLPALKRDYPYLFPKQYPDSVWVHKMNDTIQQELNKAVEEQFPDLAETSRELERLFQHIKYYFPEEEIPQVITLTSDVDYRNQVVWSDRLLLISIDTYLGVENPLYLGVQDYIRNNFSKEQIVVDAAEAFAETKLEDPRSRTFLSNMIYYGKLLYLKDLLVPFKSDAQKIGYTPEQLEWAIANEAQIWRYFVEKQLLYSTNSQLGPRFLFPAPFSKFYLELDNEAPARLGQFTGWQILKQYMQRTEVSVEEMLKTDAETIFKQSNYKPNK